MTNSPSEQYVATVQDVLSEVVEQESDAITAGARLLADAVDGGGVVHVFGAGHSQLVAADATFRAGGPAWANGILDTALFIGRGAIAATATERIPEMADAIFDQVQPRPTDATVVVTNSGITPISVRWAELARERGLPVIGISSRHSLEYFGPEARQHIGALADVLLDNHCPLGDAATTFGGTAGKGPTSSGGAGPTSTIVNSFLFHWLAVSTHELLQQRGREVDAFRSGHMPDSHDFNARLMAKYSDRVDAF